jgi:RimJ/RimL family protein N-acetyltransferase
LRHDVHLAGYTYGLRPVATSDAPYVVELRAAGGEFINRGATTLAAQLAWLAHYFERHGDYCFVIERIDGGRREGLVGVYDVRLDDRSAEWGRFVLARGSNAAVETALLVYRFAFDVLALERVRCRTLAGNAKVIAFHESCGLARKPSSVTIDHDGQRSSGVEHELAKDQWPAVMKRLDALAARFAATTRSSLRTPS